VNANWLNLLLYSIAGEVNANWLNLLLYSIAGEVYANWLNLLLYSIAGEVNANWLNLLLYSIAGEVNANWLSLLLYSIALRSLSLRSINGLLNYVLLNCFLRKELSNFVIIFQREDRQCCSLQHRHVN